MQQSSSSSVGSVGACGNTYDDSTQALKRRKLEEPQKQPLVAEPGAIGLDRDDRVDRSVAFQVRSTFLDICPRSIISDIGATSDAVEQEFRNRVGHSIFEP